MELFDQMVYYLASCVVLVSLLVVPLILFLVFAYQKVLRFHWQSVYKITFFLISFLMIWFNNNKNNDVLLGI